LELEVVRWRRRKGRRFPIWIKAGGIHVTFPAAKGYKVKVCGLFSHTGLLLVASCFYAEFSYVEARFSAV